MIELQELTDLALGRYAAQWAGTQRGLDALTEIAQREEIAAQFAFNTHQAVRREVTADEDVPFSPEVEVFIQQAIDLVMANIRAPKDGTPPTLYLVR